MWSISETVSEWKTSSPALYLLGILCAFPTGVIEDNKVDFLGMSLDGSAATAGQWTLLALGLVFLLTTILLAYKYRKSKKHHKSSSTMELK